MSEIKRITDKATLRCAEGRNKPSVRSEDWYVVDLIYLLEQSTSIINQLCQGTSVITEGAVTIKQLQDIVESIGDPNLSAFFMNKLHEGMGMEAPANPLRIADG